MAIAALFTFVACGGNNKPDATVPTVTLTSPADTVTDVLLDTNIAITFSEAMNKASVMDSLLISPSPGSYASTWSGNTLAIDPDSSLTQFTSYTVTVGGSSLDADGTAMGTGDSFTFTTGDDDVPTVTTKTPADRATGVSVDTDITITFSEAMDKASIASNLIINPSPGSYASTWSGNTLTIDPDSSLADSTVYTVTVGASSQDIEGTAMGTADSFTFSTGDTITGAIVSGTIFGDPDSTHDDDLTDTFVVLMSGPPWEAEAPYQFYTGSDGVYQFDYVQSGTYYPVAALDTNTEDGGLYPQFGDAAGEYLETTITVVGSDLTDIDIGLVDPEAISGQVFYSGNYSWEIFSNISSTMEFLQVYAYEATTAVFYQADMTLASSPNPGVQYTVAHDWDDPIWPYWLNPFMMPELSVSGSFAYGDTLTQTADEYIPPGNYQVMGYLEIPSYIDTSQSVLIGFADNLAEIADTGDDAGMVDITLYDTIMIKGNMTIASLDDEAPYSSATVTLLGWPLDAVTSNEYINTDAQTNGWIYWGAPIGLPVLAHSEPDPADAGTLMAWNQYVVYDASAAWIDGGLNNDLEELSVLSRSTMDAIAALAGTTIDPARAQFVGNVHAWNSTLDEVPVVGATVTISTGDHVVYMYSDMSLAPFTQPPNAMVFILNIDPSPDGKSTITISHPDSSFAFDSVTIPIRIDEMTSWESDMIQGSVELAQGVTISGVVWDNQADTRFGSGATMTLTHEDGTVLDTALSDSSSELAFHHVPSLMPVYLKTSYAGTGYVPNNTAVFGAYASTFLGNLVHESLAAPMINMLPAFNEPAWNSTLQSYAWFVFEVQEKLSGVTFTTDAPGAMIYYWDGSAYTISGPTTSSDGGPQVFGYAPGTSEGLWTFTLSGAYAGSVDTVLITGEVIDWRFE